MSENLNRHSLSIRLKVAVSKYNDVWDGVLLNILNSNGKMRQLQSSRFILASNKTRTSCICIQSLVLIITHPSDPEHLYAFVIIVMALLLSLIK
jgi:hypothetical protein